MVDLNRMHFGKLTPKQCLRNFERLTWDPNVIRYIVTEYAKKRGWDIDKSVKAAQHFQADFFRKWAKKNGTEKTNTTEMTFKYYNTNKDFFKSKHLYSQNYWLSLSSERENLNNGK